jgi:hypothetical protein
MIPLSLTTTTDHDGVPVSEEDTVATANEEWGGKVLANTQQFQHSVSVHLIQQRNLATILQCVSLCGDQRRCDDYLGQLLHHLEVKVGRWVRVMWVVCERERE